MTDLKIMTTVLVVAGIVVTFIDRLLAPRPRWLGGLAWFVASAPALLYIVPVRHRRRHRA
jgi:hypothetical protein